MEVEKLSVSDAMRLTPKKGRKSPSRVAAEAMGQC